MNNHRGILGFAMGIVILAGLLGCNSNDGNPIASERISVTSAPPSERLASSVHFKILLPEYSSSQAISNLQPSVRAVGTTSPLVTFKLILVNIGNTTAPTTTLVKEVTVGSDGSAVATFTGVPAKTVLGDIHIEGGKIGLYSDFHGALDLSANADNTLVVGPKGSKTLPDILAQTIAKIVSTPDLLDEIIPSLASKVTSIVQNLDLNSSTIVDQAVSQLENDTMAPVISSVNPANGARWISLDTNLQITFNEPVVKGTGNISIYDLKNVLYEQIPVGDARISVSNNTVTINPTTDFGGDWDYYVLIDGSCFQDTAGNKFAGISQATAWKFTTLFLFNEDYLWNLGKIGFPEAWKMSTGRGVTVAILDSGFDALHADLQPNYLAGYDYVDDDAYPFDFVNGHGSHVAGIIAGVPNNGGIIGLAPRAAIVPLRVIDTEGYVYSAGAARAICESADIGIKIMNMSYGGPSSNAVEEYAINYAAGKGCLMIAASGNNNGPISYPAKYPVVLSVGATDENDNRCDFSNYGSELFLTAPGINIYSSYPIATFKMLQGTSMACPHVAGLAALLWAKDPTLTASDIVAIMGASAIDLGDTGRDVYYGWGRIRADTALKMLDSLKGSIRPSVPPVRNSVPKMSIQERAAQPRKRGEVIIALEEGQNIVDILAKAGFTGLKTKVSPRVRRLATIYVSDGQEEAFIQKLESFPGVAAVDFNHILKRVD